MKQALLLTIALTMAATATAERERLYTAPDPAAAGGIQGTIENPTPPIEQILAVVISPHHKRSTNEIPFRRMDQPVGCKAMSHEPIQASVPASAGVMNA